MNARSDLDCHHFLFSTVADVANLSLRLNGTHRECISAATSSVRLDSRITDGMSRLVVPNTGRLRVVLSNASWTCDRRRLVVRRSDSAVLFGRKRLGQ